MQIQVDLTDIDLELLIGAVLHELETSYGDYLAGDIVSGAKDDEVQERLALLRKLGPQGEQAAEEVANGDYEW